MNVEVGGLIIFTGPMFSGKSTRMVSALGRDADITDLKVLLINHSSDSERHGQLNSSGIVTIHGSSYQNLSPKVERRYASRLSDLDVSDYQIVGVDESQFFMELNAEGKSEFVATVRHWVVDQKKLVYLAGLNGSWQLQNFGYLHELFYLASKIKLCKATCFFCRNPEIQENGDSLSPRIVDAGYTWKIGGDMTQEKEVGAANKYVSVCLQCRLQQF